MNAVVALLLEPFAVAAAGLRGLGSWGHPPRARGCALVMLTMLTGCTVGPDFHTPPPPAVSRFLPTTDASGLPAGDTVPGQVLARGAPVPERWWELFRSPQLNRLVEDGIRHNADLQAAEAAVRVAVANALAQRGALFPTINAEFDSTRQKVPTRTLQTNAASGADTYSVHTAQLTITYVADIWGGVRRQVESVEAQAELQAYQREAVFLTLTTNIALAAIQEASLRGQIAATRRLIGIQNELLEILRRQHEKGQIALPDVVVQETAVAQARLLLAPLERQLAQQRDLLAFLTGRFPSEDVRARFELASFRLPPKLPLTLPADLVRKRPDVRATEANLHAVNAQIGVAIANRLPQLTLSGNAGSSADAISRLFSPGTLFWLVAGNAVQPLFDGRTREYKQRAAEQATVQAAAQYRSAVLAAFQNVADVLRALQADTLSIAAATTAEQSANRSIDLIRKQVEQGQVSAPVLLVSQQAFLQTSLARVQAQAARLADTVALIQALGGGWSGRPTAGPALLNDAELRSTTSY